MEDKDNPKEAINASAWNMTALNLTSYWISNEPQDSQFRQIIKLLDYYIVPMVVVIGLAGNGLSCLVFLHTPLKSLSSSVYLASLAIADSGFLICVFFSWSTNVGLQLYNMAVACQLFTFSSYIFSFLSVWLVVGFTVERYIATCFPFKRNEMCTTRRAKLVVIMLVVVSLLIYSYALWTSSVQLVYDVPLCSSLYKYFYLLRLMVNLDTLLTFLLPFLTLFVLNIRIACAVAKINRHRSHVITTFHHSPTTLTSAHNRNQVKVTVMLLVVSSCFLILNLPKHILHILTMYFLSLETLSTANYSAMEKLVTYIFYLNYSINFFLYSVCGKNFRVSLKVLYERCRLKILRRKDNKTNGHNLLLTSLKSHSGGGNYTIATAV